MFYIDSHFHLQDERFEGEREEIIKRAITKGVKGFLVPFDLSEDHGFDELVYFKEKYENFFIAAGVHPHNAKHFKDGYLERIIKLKEDGMISAIGEIGLDFYYNFSKKEEQIKALKSQLELSKELSLPVIVHIRDAFKEIKNLLFDKELKGVLHSYTGDVDFLKEAIFYNFYISYSGMITFKKAEKIRGALLNTPKEKLLFETDSPYLAPVPFRGKRNEPSNVLYVYEKAGKCFGIEIDKLKDIVFKNFFDFIGN